MFNLVFETDNVLKLFETPYVYFEALSVFRGRGDMQVGRGRVREENGFVHQLRAPFCSPRQKSLCWSEYSADKKQVRDLGL